MKTLANNASTSQSAKSAYVEEIEISAVYSTITRKVIDIPAIYKTVTKQVLVKKGSIASWQEIDCDLVQAQDLNIIWNTSSATLTATAKREVDRVLYLSLIHI